MKHNLWSIIKKSMLHSRGHSKLVYKKRPLTRTGKALIGNYPKKSIFYSKGNLMKIERKSIKKGKVEFWHMKLIHELFPKNIPQVRAVEPLKENGRPTGYILHLKEVELNQELRNYMNTIIKKGKHAVRDTDFQAHLSQVSNNTQVSRLIEHMGEWGIQTKYRPDGIGIGQKGNASNVSIANPNEPVFFEPKIILKEKFKKQLKKSKFSKKKKKKLMKYYERLLEAEKALARTNLRIK